MANNRLNEYAILSLSSKNCKIYDVRCSCATDRFTIFYNGNTYHWQNEPRSRKNNLKYLWLHVLGKDMPVHELFPTYNKIAADNFENIKAKTCLILGTYYFWRSFFESRLLRRRQKVFICERLMISHKNK